MEDRVLRKLQRASETTGPDLNPFKAIWTQWEIEGAPPGDREVYVKAEQALKQALSDLRETNVPEFAGSRDVERYAAALREAIKPHRALDYGITGTPYQMRLNGRGRGI